MYSTTYFLRELCIKYNWFTCGTCEQYEKLFEINKDGCPLEDIALVIWLCSDENWDYKSIRSILKTEKRKFLNQCNGYEK